MIRHRCHNRRCINPQHLQTGTRADNLRDERDRRANGVDWKWL
ncbi:HNH endonuclease [Thiosulfatihalobacter marinus]